MTTLAWQLGARLARDRWAQRRHELVMRLAAVAGTVLRLSRPAVRVAPGVAGAGLVSLGLGMLAPWLGVVTLGVFCLMLDRRIG